MEPLGDDQHRTRMQITNLTEDDSKLVAQAAELLVDGFSDPGSDSWRTETEALESVRESLEDNHICRITVDAAGAVMGWIGGMPTYRGRVWELHPLVVRRDRRGRGDIPEDQVDQQLLLRSVV